MAGAEISPGDRVLEIGPGLGALTRPLLDAGARVLAVEVDPRIADYLEDELGGHPGFELHCGDVLRLALDELIPEDATLVGNLPYSITGPILARLIERADRFPRAVIMVQKEVGTRILAGAGGKEIGAPAVLLRTLYSVRSLFDVGRGAFLPRPEIVSVVLRCDRIAGASLPDAMREAVNAAYVHRRKMLRKTLSGRVASEGAIVSALVELGLPETARPEDLEPEQWPTLLRLAKEERS